MQPLLLVATISQKLYAKYQKDRTELLDWVAEQDREKDKVIRDFQDTD